MARIDVVEDPYVTVYEYRIQDVFDLRSASIWVANLQNIPSITVKKIELEDHLYRMEEGNHSQSIPVNSSSEEIFEKSKEFINFIDVDFEYEGKGIILCVDIRDFTIRISMFTEDIVIIDEIEDILKLKGD